MKVLVNANVIKRDGTKTPFDFQRIENAVRSAADRTQEQLDVAKITYDVCKELANEISESGCHDVPVEHIQDEVVNRLLHSKWKKTAEQYISYRKERDIAREGKEALFKDINNLLERPDGAEILSENANRDSRIIPTIKSLVADSVGKHFANKYILPKDIVDAHESGDIHFHDRGELLYPMFNCMLIDLRTMLHDGFCMGNANIEQPNSIRTACSIAAQVVTAVGSHIYGGNTLPELDITLAPYVEKTYQKHLQNAKKYHIPEAGVYAKDMTRKDTIDGIQALYYQLNTIVSTQGQTVFCTLTCGLGTTWQEKLVQECMLNQQMEGLGKEKKTFVFPKLVFQVKKGINFDETDPNYDMFKLAAKCSASRLYPDLLFMDRLLEVQKTKAVPMGCRSFLAPWFNEQGEEIYHGRNNLGCVTVNLPRCGIEAKGDIDKFWQLLDERCELAHKALQCRIKRLENVTASVAPILYCSGAMGVKLKPEDKIIDIMKNGRASVSLGLIGIHETIWALFNEDVKGNHEEFALDIMKFFRNKADQWKIAEGYGYSVYNTPAENLCYRFCNLDKEKFGIIDNVTDKEYYTNSFHRTVEDSLNVFEKAIFESPYPEYGNGGFISYGEYPSMIGKEEELLTAWKEISKYQSYYGTNLPSDQCFKCGYEGEFEATADGYRCPVCGNTDEGTISVIRRVCGYLSSLGSRPVNKGKQDEMVHRVKHYK